jgi:ribonuclease HII
LKNQEIWGAYKMTDHNNKDMLYYELEAYLSGYKVVAGVDEAGRGPLAGPVVAAAVILPRGLVIDGIDDSKKLSEKKRNDLFKIIKQKAVDFSVSYLTNEEIDKINILNASLKAMKKALDNLNVKPDYALIDGNTSRFITIKHLTIIKGDQKSASIAAASILAKVTRDNMMEELDKIYPDYKFAKHKGYPTKEHISILKEIGPCEIHRKSFLKNIIK